MQVQLPHIPYLGIFGSGVLQPYLIPILYVPVYSRAGAMCAYVQVWVYIYAGAGAYVLVGM